MSILEAVIEMAKEMMLEQGEHAPILYIEYKDSKTLDICLLAGMPETSLDRQKYLFMAGRKVGLEYKDKEVNMLCFAHEAWMVSYEKDGSYPYDKPSDDPNRKEVLLVEMLDCGTGTISQSMQSYEILRASGTVDLLPGHKQEKDVYSRLLISFLAGITRAGMDDREFDTFIREHKR